MQKEIIMDIIGIYTDDKGNVIGCKDYEGVNKCKDCLLRDWGEAGPPCKWEDDDDEGF